MDGKVIAALSAFVGDFFAALPGIRRWLLSGASIGCQSATAREREQRAQRRQSVAREEDVRALSTTSINDFQSSSLNVEWVRLNHKNAKGRAAEPLHVFG
jgi:hypothetical protein